MLLDTPICDFGWKAPAFTLSDPDGASHSLDSLMGENGLLVAFICNHCPYVKAIAENFSSDAMKLKEIDVGIAAIMPNDFQAYPEDSPP